ncbi:V-type ATP synthase subunit F [Eubacteriales bacterium OttesenSCG-928-M02]|nr:V-type ATP synthase subunit F [Eubacteriales bacterium OttesenSCG-928-M02]
MSRIAAIGDKDSVLGFSALSIDVFPTKTGEETTREIFRLAREGYAVIFITEEAAAGATDMIERFRTEAYPAIIPIPSNQGASGVGTEMLKKNVEKALGADILFGKEE